jgi:hypothetical protein
METARQAVGEIPLRAHGHLRWFRGLTLHD